METKSIFEKDLKANFSKLNKNLECDVLIIGGGTGAATKEILKHKSVEQVVVVDIDEVVVNTCKEYLPEIAGCLNDERVTVEITDAFDYIKQTDKKLAHLNRHSPKKTYRWPRGT